MAPDSFFMGLRSRIYDDVYMYYLKPATSSWCPSSVKTRCLVDSCGSSSAQIQKMKNAVPKNDKKKRKQMTEDIAKLEADLSQKHEEELRQLKSTTDTKVNVAD